MRRETRSVEAPFLQVEMTLPALPGHLTHSEPFGVFASTHSELFLLLNLLIKVKSSEGDHRAGAFITMQPVVRLDPEVIVYLVVAMEKPNWLQMVSTRGHVHVHCQALFALLFTSLN